MGRRIDAERRYQMRIGFSREYDQKKGVPHLLQMAMYYFLRLHWIQGAAMVVAAYQSTRKDLYQWGARSNSTTYIYLVGKDGADVVNQYKKLYGYPPDFIWKEY